MRVVCCPDAADELAAGELDEAFTPVLNGTETDGGAEEEAPVLSGTETGRDAEEGPPVLSGTETARVAEEDAPVLNGIEIDGEAEELPLALTPLFSDAVDAADDKLAEDAAEALIELEIAEAAVTGHTVVKSTIVSVTTVALRAGQSVMLAAHEVIVRTVVA